MIERRKCYEVKLGNGDILYRIVIESVDCPKEGNDATFVKNELLRQIANNYYLVTINGLEFETLTISHKNNKWVIEAKVVQPKAPQS